jgi:ABC-type polysaccharide/polyol phosphate export permease
LAVHMWGRMGWQEVKRRYRRTLIGPFWTTLSLGIFIFSLGLIWAELWKMDPRQYLPYLCSGLLAYTLVSSIITESCTVFWSAEGLIKQLRFPYTILTCTVVWRNCVVFLHNLLIFVLVAIYAGIDVNANTLLVLPGIALVCLNGIWISTLLGLMCSRFRDIQQVITSILQIAMFVTPIFWAPTQLGARFSRFVDWNILFHLVDVIRSPLLGTAPRTWTYIVVIGLLIVGWTVTLALFSRFRRRVAYWI